MAAVVLTQTPYSGHDGECGPVPAIVIKGGRLMCAPAVLLH